MDWKTFECPTCEARRRYQLDVDADRHLRQCPSCNHWMIVTGDKRESRTTYHIAALEHPPTCPVDGCGVTVNADELAPHIIENHDGALS